MAELKHENKSVEPLQSLLEQVKRRIETVVDKDNRMNQKFSKKLKDCINDSFELISEQNKLLTTALNQDNTSSNKYNEENILFIESHSIVGKKKLKITIRQRKTERIFQTILITYESQGFILTY